MLEIEYGYFQNHKVEIKKKYLGKFVVIKGEAIIGVYPTAGEALKESSGKNEIGTFLIQEVVENDSDIIQRFHSRVFV